MSPVPNIISNLLAAAEKWTSSSKVVIVITLFIFAAIPLIVIGGFVLGILLRI